MKSRNGVDNDKSCQPFFVYLNRIRKYGYGILRNSNYILENLYRELYRKEVKSMNGSIDVFKNILEEVTNIVLAWISNGSVIVTIVIAYITMRLYNEHTKKNEELERKNMKIEVHRMLLEELRDQSNLVHENITLINSKNIVNLLDRLKKKDPGSILKETIAELHTIVLKVDHILALVENPITKANWGDMIEFENGQDYQWEPKQNLYQQIELLKQFMVKLEKLLSANSLDKDEDWVEIFKLVKEYKEESKSDNVNSESNNKKKDYLTVMVGLRGSRSDDGWAKQSLGNWKIADKKRKYIKYIVGIDVDTRNLVSMVKVKGSEKIGDRVRFEPEDSKEQGKDIEKKIEVNEAVNWNPRNPVRYITREEEQIKEMFDQLSDVK